MRILLGVIFFFLIITVTNAQNVTGICDTCTAEVCARCLPKSWTDYLNPTETLSSIVRWTLTAIGFQLPSITISLIGLLIIVMTIWLLASKIDKILLLIVIILVMTIVITSVLHMINPNLLPIQ